jgi:hypothetical protein
MSPQFFNENLGVIIMKSKELVFYAISAFCLCLFILLPLAVEFSIGEYFPRISLLQEWIKTGDEFALSK